LKTKPRNAKKTLGQLKVAPDREDAFADAVRGIDLALERHRGLGR
jgi:hypothetical protein